MVVVNHEVETESAPTYQSKLLKRYCTLKSKLGRGSQGEVWLAKSRSPLREPFAVKMLPASREAWGEIAAYQAIGSHPQHANLLQAKLLIAEDKCINLLLEACRSDLLDYVLAHPAGLPEHQCLRWSRQLCDAVAHLHAIGVVHLDIKLENILLQGAEGADVVKLGDFGLSSCDSGQQLARMCGSGIYRAPEVSLVEELGPYEGRPADVWSIGVCIFVMARGCFPFAAHAPTRLLKEQRGLAGEVTGQSQSTSRAQAVSTQVGVLRKEPVLRSGSQRAHLSRALLDLLDDIFVVEPQDRPTSAALLGYLWLCGDDTKCAMKAGPPHPEEEGYSTPSSPQQEVLCDEPIFIDARRGRKRRRDRAEL